MELHNSTQPLTPVVKFIYLHWLTSLAVSRWGRRFACPRTTEREAGRGERCSAADRAGESPAPPVHGEACATLSGPSGHRRFHRDVILFQNRAHRSL